MKKYILVLIAVFSINMVSGQGLVIELAVIWKNENVYLNEDFIRQPYPYVPYLKFTYKNFSPDNIYFKNSFGDANVVFYKMGINTLHSPNVEELNLTDFFKMLAKEEKLRLQENYIVDIHNCYFKNTHPCLVFYETKYEDKERDIGIGIDYDLYYLTELLYMQEQLNKHYPKKQILLFNHPDKSAISLKKAHKLLKRIETDNISTDFKASEINFSGLKNHFVFIKSGDVYEREINLLPLLLLGGKYHLKFTSLKMNNFIDGGYIRVNNKLKKEEFALPKELESYKLYDKAFISNEVRVDFSTIR